MQASNKSHESCSVIRFKINSTGDNGLQDFMTPCLVKNYCF